jgi:PIN domain nuclease of toxin-antitoxin system
VGPLNLLLDTCTFLWMCAEPHRLSTRAVTALDSAELIGLSDAVILEICLKWHGGKLRLPEPPRHWITDQVRQRQLRILPIDQEICFRMTEMEMLHRDPFDRMLIAQAQIRNLTILTPDKHIHRYPVSILW